MSFPSMRPLARRVYALRIGLLATILSPCANADDAAELSKVTSEVFSKEQRDEARGTIERDIVHRTREFNAHNRDEWSKITSRDQWEKFRDERIERLRRSLGDFPPPGKSNSRVTGTIEGDGFRIENVVYESRPGQWVTGNLYVPAAPSKSMPGILVAHAHHRDKPQSELQDMGMTWARAGCLVLMIDQVGYGERRSHPFNGAADFPQSYKVSRQDYFFRYDNGVRLQLLGDSLMGWMTWDLMRGIDLLLARDGIDPQRIIILGAVAGGGDPAGVTAALDRRVACCVPFNFGGPQPESRYPLPEDAETSFNYLGGTYWDSTRGLRLGGRDDFPHWLIVASTAPRRLIHAHEFSWDQARDPVWKRYEKIWGEFYGASGNLGFAHGTGYIRVNSPDASHCTNIGKQHRRMIHPLFERWFDIKVGDKDEYSQPRMSEELICMTDSARQELNPKTLTELMIGVGTERIEKARKRLFSRSPVEQRQLLQDDWSKLLGPIAPASPPIVKTTSTDKESVGGATVERLILEVEPGIVVPVVILASAEHTGRSPVVVGLAQAGKAGFMKERGEEVHKLIKAGTAVVLPDLRGTGETRSGSSRGQSSGDTDLSTHVQLFGQTLLGQRLRDLRSLLVHLRERRDIDMRRLAVWGDSFTPPNSAETNFIMPRGIDGWPRESEPLGGLLALLGGLFEDDVRAIYVSGGLASYHSVLTHFAVLIPHDASVPGALTAGDLCDLAAALSPRPLRFEGMVDHLNRTLPSADVRKSYSPTVQAYSTTPQALGFADTRTSPAAWLLEQLK